MKAVELVNTLCEKDCLSAEGTVDTFKFGDPETELSKVALCFIATPEVIKESAAWGADMIITHEPTFYDHWDRMPEHGIALAKKQLLEETGIVLFRYHDHSHLGIEGRDLFSEGFVEALGWKGTFTSPLDFVLDEPLSPREMVRSIEEKLDVHHIRLAGETDRPATKVSLLLGARGGEWYDFISSDSGEVAIGGEVCEWAVCESVRDAAQLGIPKTAIVLGHAASERDGMKYITRLVTERFGDRGIDFRYFESGETYTAL